MSLAGRNAIITGASQGLGLAIAAAYVEAGASVLLIARGRGLLENAETGLRGSVRHPGQTVASIAGDVSDRDTCASIVQRAEQLLGPITILVNNAGIYGPKGLVEEVDWDAWVEAIRINLFGTVLMCRAVLPGMRRRGYGKIVNLSGGGATAPLPRLSAYAASKAAVVRLTETFAEEVRGAHIDVNAIAPGALNTRLLDEVLAAGPGKVGRDFYERSLKQQADGGTKLEKAAALAVFLASAESDAITGRLLSAVWDDWAALPGHRDELEKQDVYTLRRIIPKDRGLDW
jgi:3-oxoacyl-[acyl-carrier protein] reductase